MGTMAPGLRREITPSKKKVVFRGEFKITYRRKPNSEEELVEDFFLLQKRISKLHEQAWKLKTELKKKFRMGKTSVGRFTVNKVKVSPFWVKRHMRSGYVSLEVSKSKKSK